MSASRLMPSAPGVSPRYMSVLAAWSAVRRAERRELVRHLEPLRREAEERRRPAAGTARRAQPLDPLEHPASNEHALQVRRRHVVPERRDVDLAQLRDRERRRREREADVGVRELRAQPRLRGRDELAPGRAAAPGRSASRRRRARPPGRDRGTRSRSDRRAAPASRAARRARASSTSSARASAAASGSRTARRACGSPSPASSTSSCPSRARSATPSTVWEVESTTVFVPQSKTPRRPR